jgi:hypothetical protein
MDVGATCIRLPIYGWEQSAAVEILQSSHFEGGDLNHGMLHTLKHAPSELIGSLVAWRDGRVGYGVRLRSP